MKTKKFRLTVVLSIVYSVFVLLLLGEDEHWDIADMVLPFTIFTAPVWIFWSAVWISPERLEAFFNPKLKDDVNNPKQWIYVSKAAASHKQSGSEELNDSLVQSVMSGDIDKIVELLQNGADPYAKNSMGYSAIDYARGHGNSRIERILKNT